MPARPSDGHRGLVDPRRHRLLGLHHSSWPPPCWSAAMPRSIRSCILLWIWLTRADPATSSSPCRMANSAGTCRSTIRRGPWSKARSRRARSISPATNALPSPKSGALPGACAEPRPGSARRLSPLITIVAHGTFIKIRYRRRRSLRLVCCCVAGHNPLGARMMMMPIFRSVCVLALLTGSLALGAGSAMAQGTDAERQACTPDAMRLCGDAIPDVGQGHRLHEGEIFAIEPGMPRRDARWQKRRGAPPLHSAPLPALLTATSRSREAAARGRAA